MSSTRQHLKLDEQGFQNLLAAAFTIQEHNSQRKQTGGAKDLAQELSRQLAQELTQRLTMQYCPQCGAALREGEARCDRCGSGGEQVKGVQAGDEELRPGERMQQKWASLWQMTKDKDFWPERPAVDGKAEGNHSTDAESPVAQLQKLSKEILPPVAEPLPVPDPASHYDDAWDRTPALVAREEPGMPLELALPEDSTAEETAARNLRPDKGREWDLHLTLRFQRADLYLVLAILVAVVAMVWVVSASPAGQPARAHAVQLSMWERTLVSMGLAEAPDPPVYLGNPSVQVWVDPHTALYYCPGEEQFGKTPNGHYSSQRDAQIDQFEPSGRSACE